MMTAWYDIVVAEDNKKQFSPPNGRPQPRKNTGGGTRRELRGVGSYFWLELVAEGHISVTLVGRRLPFATRKNLYCMSVCVTTQTKFDGACACLLLRLVSSCFPFRRVYFSQKVRFTYASAKKNRKAKNMTCFTFNILCKTEKRSL